jgi:hypothetical protein
MLDNADYGALVREEVMLEARRKVRELAARGLTYEEIWGGIGCELRPAERQLLMLVVRQEFESARWLRIASSPRGILGS